MKVPTTLLGPMHLFQTSWPICLVHIHQYPLMSVSAAGWLAGSVLLEQFVLPFYGLLLSNANATCHRIRGPLMRRVGIQRSLVSGRSLKHAKQTSHRDETRMPPPPIIHEYRCRLSCLRHYGHQLGAVARHKTGLRSWDRPCRLSSCAERVCLTTATPRYVLVSPWQEGRQHAAGTAAIFPANDGVASVRVVCVCVSEHVKCLWMYRSSMHGGGEAGRWGGVPGNALVGWWPASLPQSGPRHAVRRCDWSPSWTLGPVERRPFFLPAGCSPSPDHPVSIQ